MDAQLAGVGVGGADGRLTGPVDVHVGADDHGVLPAEFQRTADQSFAALLGDDPTDASGTGEHDVVGAGDHGGPQVGALAGHDLEHARGIPARCSRCRTHNAVRVVCPESGLTTTGCPP